MRNKYYLTNTKTNNLIMKEGTYHKKVTQWAFRRTPKIELQT